MTPYFQPTPLRCAECSHQWTGHIATNCRFDVALASMRSTIRAGCPQCCAKGKNAVLMVRQAAPVAEHAA